VRLRLLILTVGVAACPTRDRFDRRSAFWYCATLEACHRTLFSSWFDQRRGCRFETFDEQHGVSACLVEHCTFDRSAARACIDALRESTCAEFDAGEPLETCGHVWVGCDAGAEGCRGGLTGPTSWDTPPYWEDPFETSNTWPWPTAPTSTGDTG
jgi:hypothetical protein